jgi:hypothetical protein
MDGDLQHPPEVVPQLLNAATAAQADLVVASRYIEGGRNEGLGAVRTAVSWGSTVLAKAMFPHRLRGIRDPMSGFFLFRRDAMTRPMTPRGFKILLEMAARHPWRISSLQAREHRSAEPSNPLFDGSVQQPDSQRTKSTFPRGSDHVRRIVVAVIDEKHYGARRNSA